MTISDDREERLSLLRPSRNIVQAESRVNRRQAESRAKLAWLCRGAKEEDEVELAWLCRGAKEEDEVELAWLCRVHPIFNES